MTSSSDGEWAPVPGVAPSDADQNDEAASTLVIDDQTFELRPDGRGGTHYTWISGPNPGYGFSSSPAVESTDEHRANIRGFLSMIDPATGYIEDD